jgi:hypothetical protein
MRWPFADTWEELGGYAGGLWDSLRRETRDTGMRALIAPVEPFNRSRVSRRWSPLPESLWCSRSRASRRARW